LLQFVILYGLAHVGADEGSDKVVPEGLQKLPSSSHVDASNMVASAFLTPTNQAEAMPLTMVAEQSNQKPDTPHGSGVPVLYQLIPVTLVCLACWAVSQCFDKESPQKLWTERIIGYTLFAGGVLIIFSLFTENTLWWVLVLAGLVLYGAAYLLVYFTSERHLPQANNWLCCWSQVYVGEAVVEPYNFVFSPVLLVWHSFRIYVMRTVEIYAFRSYWRLFAGCHHFFTDEEFPPDAQSLGNVSGDDANQSSGRTDAEVVWVRASDFHRRDMRERPEKPSVHGSAMQLFDGEIEAGDVLQGALGDCWLLASMAALAEHPGAINNIFLTKELNPRGKYYLRLFDPKEGKWKTIVVDDHVPCKRSTRGAPDGIARGQDGCPMTLYSHPHDNEIWVMLLEKAVAKLCGNYHTIEGGFTEWGIHCLTGGPGWRYTCRKLPDGTGYEFPRADLIFDRDEKGIVMSTRGTGENRSEAEFFKLLQHYHRNGAVLCCGGVRNGGDAKGLVKGHAYSILQAKQARKSLTSTEYFWLLQIRNPWGDGEWTGDWSDQSGKWQEYPKVREEVQYQNLDDGTFWMVWEDFCEYYQHVGVVDLNLDINSLQLPVFDDSSRTGPAHSCALGCFRYWFCCEGPWRFFVNHRASKEKVSVRDSHVGIDASGVYIRLSDGGH